MCYYHFPWFGILAILFLILVFFRRPWWHRHWWRGGLWHGGPWMGSAWERSPEDILADRFAKGEIDEKEYNDRMAVLKSRKS